MRKHRVLALCAALSATLVVPGVLAPGVLAPGVLAQTEAPPAIRPGPTVPPANHATARRRKPAARAATNPAPAPEAYQLVPTGKPTSAQTRARQNAFGTLDEESGPSGGASRRLGIGLGGANGTTPGMSLGF